MAKVNKPKIQRSVDLILKNKQLESEFRTTVVPKLLDKGDIEEIGKWLGPDCSIPYYLQQFRNDKTLDPNFQKIEPYSKQKLEEMLEIAKKYFKKTELRGV